MKLQKAIYLLDCSMVDGEVLKVADAFPCMRFIAEAWEFVTPTAVKNCFAKCGFLIGHVCVH